MDLQSRWAKLTSALDIEFNTSEQLFSEIEQHYAEKNRYYHNLNHLEELFNHYDEHKELITEPIEVEFTIWFHDIIYSTTRPKKNEIRSAYFALEKLSSLGLNSEKVQRIFSWIEATQKHIIPEEYNSLSGQLFMDFDLAILGADREKYKRYCINIRREFGIYPSYFYKRGRRKALQNMLDTKNIFQTVLFRKKYEQKARNNIKFELEEIL